MDYSYIFSIILPFNNDINNFSQTMDTIIHNQSLSFEDNIQLIILLDSLKDMPFELKKMFDKYSKNIRLIENKIQKNIIDYDIVKNINAQYIGFLNDDTLLSFEALNEIQNSFLEKNTDVVFLLEKNHLEKDRYYSKESEKIIDLNKNNSYLNLNNSLFFIRKEIIVENKNLREYHDLWTIIMIIIDLKEKYSFINTAYYLKINNNIQYSTTQINNYHMGKLKYFFNDLSSYYVDKYKKIPPYAKEFFITQLAILIEEFDINQFGDESLFWACLNKIIGKLSSNDILTAKYVDSRKKNFLLYLHNDQKYTMELNENGLNFKINDVLIDNLNRHKVWIDLIDINNNYLSISGILQSNFSNDDITIRLVCKKDLATSYTDCHLIDYTQDERKNISYLSVNWIYRYNFDFKVEINNLINSTFYFEIEFNNKISISYNPEIAFRIPASLSTSSIYLVKEDYILYFKDNTFKLEPARYSLMLRLELSNLRKIIRDKQEGFVEAILLRLLYIVLYPIFKNRQIWLFNDRLNFAEDNALALFKYSIKKDDGINKYFIISSDSNDYTQLKKNYSHIIKFSSLKHKILYLFADKIIYAFVNEEYSNPFYMKDNPEFRKMLNGLFSFKRYFLQHGVILGDVSNSIKKYNINLSLFVTSSPLEQDSIKNDSYGFDDEVIQLLGLPRHDYLNNNNIKKQILFMPTWRSYLNYDESLFIHSEFFHTINKLFKNRKLKEILDENGYELIFRPHPELYKYKDLFDLDNVKLSDASYQDLFNESKMLITDYSSVAFDFAYLKKPIIYYQNRDDYHYQKGYFDFETMGFGKLIRDEKDLINKIKDYIENDCIMDNKYVKRVDNFFSYHDKNNCKRVYSWIKNN